MLIPKGVIRLHLFPITVCSIHPYDQKSRSICPKAQREMRYPSLQLLALLLNFLFCLQISQFQNSGTHYVRKLIIALTYNPKMICPEISVNSR